MFAAGLVEEVRGLVAKYGTLSRTAVQAVGYREVLEFLQSRDQWSQGEGSGVRGQGSGDRSSVGWVKAAAAADPRGELHTPPACVIGRGGLDTPYEASLADCIARVKARTRQFARRQETWFRSLSECTLLPMENRIEPAEVAAQIVSLAGTKLVPGCGKCAAMIIDSPGPAVPTESAGDSLPRRRRWPRFSLSWLLTFVFGLAVALGIWRQNQSIWLALQGCFVGWFAIGLVQTSLVGWRAWRNERSAPLDRQCYLIVSAVWPLGLLLLVVLYVAAAVAVKPRGPGSLWGEFIGDEGFYEGTALREAMLYVPIVIAYSTWKPVAKNPWTLGRIAIQGFGSGLALLWCLHVVLNVSMVCILVHIAIHAVEGAKPVRWAGQAFYPPNLRPEMTARLPRAGRTGRATDFRDDRQPRLVPRPVAAAAVAAGSGSGHVAGLLQRDNRPRVLVRGGCSANVVAVSGRSNNCRTTAGLGLEWHSLVVVVPPDRLPPVRSPHRHQFARCRQRHSARPITGSFKPHRHGHDSRGDVGTVVKRRAGQCLVVRRDGRNAPGFGLESLR